MRLIFIYGPPAVGKHTVGTELAKITGYKFFHNHYVVDLLVSLFKWGSEPYKRVGSIVWKTAISEAARNDINVIVTFVHAPIKEDAAFITAIKKIIQRNKGTIKFVRLTCSTKELHSRVKEPRRRTFKKLTKVNHLKKLMTDYDLTADIPNSHSLVIDNTKLTPRQCARRIKEHYRL